MPLRSAASIWIVFALPGLHFRRPYRIDLSGLHAELVRLGRSVTSPPGRQRGTGHRLVANAVSDLAITSHRAGRQDGHEGGTRLVSTGRPERAGRACWAAARNIDYIDELIGGDAGPAAPGPPVAWNRDAW